MNFKDYLKQEIANGKTVEDVLNMLAAEANDVVAEQNLNSKKRSRAQEIAEALNAFIVDFYPTEAANIAAFEAVEIIDLVDDLIADVRPTNDQKVYKVELKDVDAAEVISSFLKNLKL